MVRREAEPAALAAGAAAATVLAAFAAGCGDFVRLPCGGDSDCDAAEVCWRDGYCLPRDVARQKGGLGDECGPDRYCARGRCWAGRCVVTYEAPPGPDGGTADAGPDAPPDAGSDEPDMWVDTCGNGECQPEYFEDCVSCESDCGACCGNDECEPRYAEYCATCESDCGGCCGDGFCDVAGGEDCDCDVDCGVCLVTCGNGACDLAGGENCGNCLDDCPCCGNAAVPPPGLDYATQIQPIFDGECTLCHTEFGGPGGLRMTTYDAVLDGGANPPTVLACDCNGSILIQKLGETPPFGIRMPANGPPYLTDDQVQAICDWIDEGAGLTYTPWSCGGPPACAFCGDGSCDASDGETCATCAADCGSC